GVYYDGVYRTDDAGAHWTRVFEGHIRSVTVDPNDEDVIYAGSEPVSLFRSEDRGDHWEEISSLQNLPDEVKKEWWFPTDPHLGHVLNIFIQPGDSRVIYLSLEHGGIVRSLDRGATWEDVSGGIDYLDIHMVAGLPGSDDRLFAATARGFYVSDDPADGWLRAENGFKRDYFHNFLFLQPPSAGDPPTMLIATADKSPGSWNRPEGAKGALFRSDDAGGSWHQIGAGLPDSTPELTWALVPNPHDPNGVFIGMGGAFRGGGDTSPGTILQTRDRGDTWEPIAAAVPPVRALWAAPE
ncbi:MAG TPA: hypothetical protein VGK54_17175, partial [Chloroflexota bacterium]